MDDTNVSGRLGSMIQRTLDQGESTRSIAARAHKAGFKLSHAQVNSLHRGLVAKAPDADMVRAIAAALGTSEAEVRRAVFLDWYGYDPLEGVGFTAVVPDDLTDEERRELDTMVRAWLIARRNG